MKTGGKGKENCVFSILFCKNGLARKTDCSKSITNYSYFEIEENSEVYDAYDHHRYKELEKHREHSVPVNIKYKHIILHF